MRSSGRADGENEQTYACGARDCRGGDRHRPGHREDRDSSEVPQLKVAAQSSEVRCTGRPTGGEIPQSGDDEETLEALRQRRECNYTKWKAWSGETAAERMNERHTVWADENGFFHGRVDYWHPK